jgi:ATP:ADP antiporter, AAA family
MSALPPPTMPGQVPPRRTWLHRLVLLEPGETPAFLWSAAYFFFLLFSYYLLRPVRDEMGVRGELEDLPWLWTITTIASLIAATLFAWLTANLPRHKFVPLVYRIIGIVLIGFWIVLQTIAETKSLAAGYVFYVWVSVYNLLSVSVFWGFMATIFAREQGRRIFGGIAVGGTCGAFFGALVVTTLAKHIDAVNLILVAALFLEAVAQCALRLARLTGVRDRPLPVEDEIQLDLTQRSAADRSKHPHTAEPSRSMWAGFALVARSPYLQFIVVYVLLFTITTTLLEFERFRIIKASADSSAGRIQSFGAIDLAVNAATLVTQLFVTGRLLTRLGLITGLLLLPVLTAAGFLGLAAVPTVAMVMVFYVGRRAMHFAIERPAREVLYTVVGPDAKYKSKSFIDTFIYRSGDLLGAAGTALAAKFTLAIAVLAIPASIAWIGVSLALGTMHKREARHATSGEPPSDGSQPVPSP